jgi:hypothetical protein
MRRARLVTGLAAVVAACTLVALAGAGAAHASTSCGIMSASGHSWIVVAKSVPCAKAKAVTRTFASRTAGLHAGQRQTVRTSLLPGFVCVLASQGKPGGSCSTAGAAKQVLWIAAT